MYLLFIFIFIFSLFVNASVKINKITGIFGAEISNIKVNDMSSHYLTHLLNEHKVLLIKQQFLNSSQQINLGKKLGTVSSAHPILNGTSENPETWQIVSSNGGKNEMWHTDVTYIEKPHIISILSPEIIPTEGGDTLFADLQSSYNDLSPQLKTYLNTLEAVHKTTSFAYVGYPYDHIDNEMIQNLHDKVKNNAPVVHPVIRLHPRTYLPNIFVNEAYTSHIKNVSNIESEHILQMLYKHTTQPKYTLRIKWELGDILIWDNINTMHYAVDDYDNFERIMNRVTIIGDVPFGFFSSSYVSEDIKDNIN